MCGLFGLIGKPQTNIASSLLAIQHRGPDDAGEYLDDIIHLGFRRLSIIDLSPKGHQPMTNENQTIHIIFNGEIYNYQELRKQLLRNHTFNSHTDTEVLIHGYEEWGMDKLLGKINGMFAFCLYDKKSQLSFLVRDRIGKKPLYYYQNKNYVAFSSEVKAFFCLKDYNFSINEENFTLLMGFPYLPDNKKTLLKNVYKVPPGSYATVNGNKIITVKKYWNLPEANDEFDFQTGKQNLEKLLIDSVTRRLIADVPVGVLLSGGLDSSLITAIAGKYSTEQIRTITISFPHAGIDESVYAQEVANYCSTDHTNLSLEIGNVYKEFKRSIAIYDDLSTTDSGLFSTYLLSKKVRDIGVKVILVGEGADEIFGGYTWFQLSQYPFALLPSIAKSWMYYYAIMRQLPSRRFFQYSNTLHKRLQETDGSFFKKLQAYEIQYSLPNHYCMKVDKGSMAASIEARAPYMDYRIVEYARKLSNSYFLKTPVYNPKPANEKYILRSIAEKYLPKSIVTRKKKGGMIPLYDLLENGLKSDSEIILENKYLTDYFGKGFLEKMISSSPHHPILKWQREWVLWKCLLFALWYDHYKSL